MAVTIAATPEPANVPPRMRLDLDTGNVSNSFASIEVRRDGELLRSQPPSGSNLSVVYDYDAPFGTPVTYEAEGSYYNNAASAEWTESWASLAAWSGDTADFSVSAAHARSTVASKRITRMTSADVGEVSVGGAPEHVVIELLDVGGVQVARVEWADLFGTVNLHVGTASHKSAGLAGGPAVISIYGGRITVMGAGWSRSLPFAGTVRGIGVTSIAYISGGTVAKVGAIEVTPPQALVGFTASDTETLPVTDVWLMHPVDPDRSLPISAQVGAGIYVTAESAEQISYEEQRELFAPLGRRRRVPVSYGQRRVGDWSLMLCAPTIEDRDAVLALLVDQAPLLLRVPPSLGWDLPDDWYSVGTVSDERKLDRPGQIIRLLTLPLTPVDTPVLTQGAQWTWADVLSGYATYSDVLNSFDTYLDLLTGPAA